MQGYRQFWLQQTRQAWAEELVGFKEEAGRILAPSFRLGLEVRVEEGVGAGIGVYDWSSVCFDFLNLLWFTFSPVFLTLLPLLR